MDEAKNQINDLEHIRKKKIFNLNKKKKKESKKIRIVEGAFGTTSSILTFIS